MRELAFFDLIDVSTRRQSQTFARMKHQKVTDQRLPMFVVERVDASLVPERFLTRGSSGTVYDSSTQTRDGLRVSLLALP